MLNKRFILFLIPCAAAIVIGLTTFNSCNKDTTSSKGKDANFDKVLVINEVMASNQTGIFAKDGETHDWIEIKNISSEDVSLEGYSLVYEKPKKPKATGPNASVVKEDKKDKKKDKDKAAKKAAKAKESVDNDEEEDENEDASEKSEKDGKGKKKKGPKEWSFPSVTIPAGKSIIVFASKDSTKASDESSDELHANFKLSPKRGHIQLLSASGSIMAEVTYSHLNADQSYRRLDNGTYEKSYMPTPGFENNNQGWEAYNALLDKQRKASPLLVWEVCSKSTDKNTNWAEVKNVSDKSVDLSQYYLTDNPKKPQKYHFPEKKLKPGAICTVQFAGKKAKSNAKTANFKINEEIVALTKGGKVVDGICTKATPKGTSMGRVQGKAGFFFFKEPTFDEENAKPYRFIANQPSFSHAPGVIDADKSMDITLDTHGRKVHYTTDGSVPTKESKVYKDPIHIDSSATIRAFAEGDDKSIPSPVVTGTYILGAKHSIAVMNITVKHADLYDYHSGIYATGPGAEDEMPHYGANYWEKMEKPAHVEFFDEKGREGFSEDCGLKIFGGFSRALAKKSFTIKFRSRYGSSKVSYDFFDEGDPIELQNFVVRAGGQDAGTLPGRDEFFTSLMHQQSPELLVQAYRPVALYINARYFGLYFIREKFDEHYIERHLNVSTDSTNIMMSIYCEMGEKSDYTELLEYARTKDLNKKENFDYIANHVHFISLMDQKIAQIYGENTDIGNIRFFISKDPKGDRKWHWLLYDMDAAFIDKRSVASYIRANRDTDYENNHNRLIAYLLKSKQFRTMFIERMSYHMHHTFEVKHATAVFDDLMKTIQPEMRMNWERWSSLSDYETWQKYVNSFRKKLQTQNKKVLDDFRKELSITSAEEEKYFSDLGI